jgi:hypothetical protein
MENLSLLKVKNKFKQNKIREERKLFIIKTIFTVLIYIGISEWLNSISTL